INKAFVVSGATAQEASNAIIQLSQGLSAGALRGEEFNSVNEQGGRIMQALAKHLGVTRGELRELAKEGKITSQVMMAALAGQADQIAAEFENMPLTVGRALTELRNELTKAYGSASESSGAGQAVAMAIQAIASS